MATEPEWGAGRRRGEARTSGLAPVSYLPGTGPAADAPAEGSPAVASGRRRGVHPAGSATSRRTPAPVARFSPRGGTEGDDEETPGPERDDRLDRLVLGKLRRASLSEFEVRAVLVEHGLSVDEVEEWLDRYRRLGYLDDARMAEQIVRIQHERRGRGSGAILQELARRGVEASAARAAVEEIDEESELAHATEVAVRRAGQLRGLDARTAERRLSAFLQRRGFGGEVVRQAVRTALDGEDPGADS
ncbi:regulatory protein RecX [Agromyces archimandritae]|uniref:Regulatory protein RecX n=1 Tax=Agromyces archimandritae TaxID=2781962 RepID=A0A975FN70_9MICO|nr:regulatory protein RecX [Agromyces archimandritae]QTX05021.1 RecX family transcriptional regulator [Agromyces archimandritae]